MTIQRYELLDLTSDDGPRAMVTEYEEGAYVLHADHVAEVAALKTRIAELEGEDTLWAMLDAIEKALFKKAAPHAWESVVTSAGSNFIVSRRKPKEPANEG